MMSKITFAVLLLASSIACAQDVRIGVFGLFHPHELTVSVNTGSAVVVHGGQESFILEKSSSVDAAQFRIEGSKIVFTVGTRSVRTSAVTVTSRKNDAVDFQLAIPDKIKRHYRGTLELLPSSGILMAIVSMDLETAVASVVAAESMPGTPTEALKAQAVAARSYFIAGKGRHHDFDFCDTTHCQFLRESPASNTPATKAALATRSLGMVYQSQPVAAMYTRSCSGRTHTAAELGLPSAIYPYYSVDCKYCRQHPAHWQRRLTAKEADGLTNANETARLNVDRRLGWDTVPSNDFTIQKETDHVLLRGTGMGHGIGLCQSGAKAMAQEGADFRTILDHYYPNTAVVSMGNKRGK
jgi:stage II sporulation protein D